MYCARIVLLVILPLAWSGPASTSPMRSAKRESVVCLPPHKKHLGVDRPLFGRNKCNLLVTGLHQAGILELGSQPHGLVNGINNGHAQCYVEHSSDMGDRQCYKIVHEDETNALLYATNPRVISARNAPVINVNTIPSQVVGAVHVTNVVTGSRLTNYPQMVEQNAYCDSNQQNCDPANLVIFESNGNYQCNALLDSCGGNGWLTVNKTKFEYFGELEVVCETSLCAPGYVVFEDSGCVDQLYVQSVLCVGDVLFDVFGVAHCGGGFTQEQMLSISFNPSNGLCNFITPQDVVTRVAYAGENVLRPLCGPDDSGNCIIEVVAEPDIPF
ncbi:hypothetical protein R5R35_003694 [Gryllus longicercus]|uniref:Secreted protein n=1 Tax=Gryllus longicercus TaxID=2509291 RepID=A0AAN9VAI9_9ORTH